MHHDFAWGLHLHSAIELYLVQIGCGIQVSFLISGHLLKKVVTPSFSLLLFQQQIVSRGYLVVLIVLDISHSLVQVAVWTDATSYKTVLNLAKKLVKHWHTVLTNDDSFSDFVDLDLTKPLVGLDLSDGVPFGRISIQNLLDQILTGL